MEVIYKDVHLLYCSQLSALCLCVGLSSDNLFGDTVKEQVDAFDVAVGRCFKVQEAILEILLLLAAKIDRHSSCFGQVTPGSHKNEETIISALVAYQIVPLVYVVERSPIVNAIAEYANLNISQEQMSQIFDFLVASRIPNIQL